MGVNATVQFGREWRTVVTLRFGKETRGQECKGKEEECRRSGDNRKGKRNGGRRKGRDGGRRKGREEMMVVYSKGDASINPP